MSAVRYRQMVYPTKGRMAQQRGGQRKRNFGADQMRTSQRLNTASVSHQRMENSKALTPPKARVPTATNASTSERIVRSSQTSNVSRSIIKQHANVESERVQVKGFTP